MAGDNRFGKLANNLIINETSVDDLLKKLKSNDDPILDVSYIYNPKNFTGSFKLESQFQQNQLLLEILTIQDKILLLKAAISQMQVSISPDKVNVFK